MKIITYAWKHSRWTVLIVRGGLVILQSVIHWLQVVTGRRGIKAILRLPYAILRRSVVRA
jgi:hypothetical protein